MTNFLETVLWQRKEVLLASKFRDTIYNGRTIAEYFGEKPVSNGKEVPPFRQLLERFVFPKIPAFTYADFIKHRSVYEKYPRLYLRHGDNPVYLADIRDLCAHFDKFAGRTETPVDFRPPTFFSRCYTISFVNNATGEERTERYPAENGKRPREADGLFLHLFYSDKSDAAILESVSWSDYEALKAELKTAKRLEKQKAVVERILTEDKDLLERLSR